MALSKSVTKSRAESNRANSLKSTGPRTVEGKRNSSRNALQHGLTSTHIVVLPTEDPDAYQAFLTKYQKMFVPETIQEQELVETLANARWRLNRCGALESGLFTLGTEDADEEEAPAIPIHSTLAPAQAFKASPDLFLKLSTYEQRLMRVYQSNKKELDTLQAARRQATKAEYNDAVRVRDLLLRHDCPFDPADFGFVSTYDEIELSVYRNLAVAGKLEFIDDDEDDSPEALAS